jgi:hypothetical protein
MYKENISILHETFSRSQESLQAGQLEFDSQQVMSFLFAMSISAKGPTQLSVPWAKEVPLQKLKGWNFKLPTHFLPVLRLKMCGAIPPLPHTSAWH